MQSVLLSGFDAFGNIDRNPTREIVEELGGNVLQVSTVHADRAVEEMCRLEFSVIVHLGVNANANTFNLEQFAYNNATFKIPDTSGYCAQRENIVQEMEFDAKLTCKLDVGKLCDELGDAGYQVQVSSDPGRYICNWI